MARRRSSGAATYVRELRSAIETIAPSDLHVEWLLGPPGLPQRNRLTSLGNLVLDLLWMHVWVPLIAWWRGAALVHASFNWAPWWSPCPTVVTLQDLAWERFPSDYPPGFRRYARLFARHSTRRARRVITPSRSTARDLVALYGIPETRLRPILLGAAADDRPREGEREPFVLSVAVLHRRKRIAELVRGHRLYLERAPREPPPCRLVVVGGPAGDEDAVAREAGPGCEIRGFVERSELRDLYRRATLFVYPSAYEGFGLPVAEAMAHGCPVLVARNSSLPEVAGDTAIYLESATPEGIAAALAQALADRRALAERGEAGRRDVLRRLSWEATARATLDVYREVLAE